MKRLLFNITLIGLIGVGLITSGWAAAAEKTIKMKWAEYVSPADVKFKTINYFVKRIAEETNGQVKIDVYPSQTLVKLREMFDALMDGRIDICLFSTPYYVGKMPAMELYNAPYILSSHAGEFSLLEARGEHVRMLTEEFKKFNMKYLEWGVETPNGALVMRDKLVKDSGDLKNLKIRGAGINAQILAAWGAKGVSMPRPEVYMALQRGVIDGAWTSTTAVRSDNMWEVTDYVTDTGVCMGGMLASMNLKLWNSLPDDVKKAFEKLGREIPQFVVDVQTKDSEETRVVFKEKFKGMFVIEPNTPTFDKFWGSAQKAVVGPKLKKLGPKYEKWYESMLKAQKEIRAEKGW